MYEESSPQIVWYVYCLWMSQSLHNSSQCFYVYTYVLNVKTAKYDLKKYKAKQSKAKANKDLLCIQRSL